MKTKILGLLVVTLLIINTALSVIGKVNDLQDSNDYNTGNTQLENMKLSFSNLEIEEKSDGLTLKLHGTNDIFLKYDYYIIPTHIETFIFPFGTEILDVLCTPMNIHSERLTKKLSVAPKPTTLGEKTFEITEKSDNNVAIHVWYSWDVGVGMNGNEHCVIVKVQTFPVQYYPENNYIDWAEQIDVNIVYSKPKYLKSYNEEYQFIVLTPDIFSDKLETLITYKNNRNISTKLVTLEEIYSGLYFPVEGRDDPERIKYFIKNAIENWGTNYVLLVGGCDQFPVRFTHVYLDFIDDEGFISDLYYADIYGENNIFSSWDTNGNNIFGEYDWNGNYDEVDLYPDVYLGRLACVDEEEVTTCVNKIIQYETGEAFLQEWFSKLIVIGGDTFPMWDGIDEGEYANQYVIGIMEDYTPTKCWASLGTLETVSDVSDVINEGAGFIHYSGHGGGGFRWRTHPHENENIWLPNGFYKNDDVLDLNNGDRLPIIIIMACSACKFNYMADISGWAFISNPNGGGIASCGASTTALGYVGEYTINGLFEKLCDYMFSTYKMDHTTTFGQMWAWSLNKYIWPTMKEGDLLTVEEFQPFGDPTLTIADNAPPNKPARPSGETSGKTGEEYIYTTSTTDPEGDDVFYLFNWGNGMTSFILGPYKSGAECDASGIWFEKGDYEIKVKAIDTHNAESEWSEPLSISMPKSKSYTDKPFQKFLQDLKQRFPLLARLLQLSIFNKLLDLR